MKIVLYLALLLPVCFTENIHAGGFSALQEDLETVAGSILLRIDGQYVTDLDHNSGLNIGDIMTLVISTNKVLNEKTLVDKLQPVGFLQVSDIKRGYAYLTHIQGKIKPKKGSKVVRYLAVPARFINVQDTATELIKGRLSNFKWLDQSSEKKALITFKQEGDKLSVLSPQNTLLYQYQIGKNAVLTSLVKPRQPNIQPFKELEAQGRLQTIKSKIFNFID